MPADPDGGELPPADTPHVLIVDDEPELGDLYAEWLSGVYSVTAVYDGEVALEAIERGPTPDVVLLDRLMSDISGDEVLERLHEAVDTRVAMITGVPPDFDIVDLPYDEYVVKPVSKADLHDVVDSLLRRSDYSAEVQRYYTLNTKRAKLEERFTAGELRANPDYHELLARIDRLEATLDDLAAEVTSKAPFDRLFMELDA
ncbi:MAG: HalX domain-containing protein [Halorientalis sp.]